MIRIPHFTSRRATDSRRSKLNSLAVYVFCALLLAASVARGQEASAPSFRLPDAPAGKQTSTIEARIRRGEAPLSRIYEGIALDSSAIYRLPPLEKREMGQDGSAKRLKIGAVRILPETLEPGANARIYRVPNGRVSLIGIESAAALQVRVQFMNVNLPKGAKLFVYSMRNRDEIYGSFEGRGPLGNGEFWTPPVEGDGIIIEYFSPGDESRTVFPFQISRITHIFKDAAVIETPSTDAAGSCNLSVTAEWANIAKSVGRLSFVSGGGSYVCTGTMLNTQTNDGSSKYLLTANHCISTQAEAQSLRVRWFYDTPSSAPVYTDGSNLLATGTQSDFTLLQLTGALPGGVTLAGWTTTMPTVSTPVTGIHHPAGDYKRIAFGGRRAGGCPAGLMCLPVGWDAGTTEGGSSGSGLWVGSASSAPQLVGNLSGGDASCSNLTGSDYYGRFDITYPSIASYLSPTPPPINPLDTVDYFVRQQYRDFLNREADASGLQFWTQTLQGYLNACGTT
ncbi:MAG: hypothetical protein H0V27_04930, partial [Pyrinomonadaceae bacterium]|nr:hypothetical protein [Pyrinomonadaceae bacterium]